MVLQMRLVTGNLLVTLYQRTIGLDRWKMEDYCKLHFDEGDLQCRTQNRKHEIPKCVLYNFY